MNDVISHHGVKGMRWGVWNDETRRKYLGGSKLSGTKTLPKGLEMKRISNPDDDPLQRGYLYTTVFDKDHSMYKNTNLPASKNAKEISVYSMRLSKDAKFADGEKVVNAALEDALEMSIDDYVSKVVKDAHNSKSKTASGTMKDLKEWTKEMVDSGNNISVRHLLNTRLNGIDPEQRDQANRMIWYHLALTVGSYAKVEEQEKFRQKMRKAGYDVMMDPEDYVDDFTKTLKNITAPLIILDPKNMIDPDSISKRTMPKRQFDKEADAEWDKYMKPKKG